MTIEEMMEIIKGSFPNATIIEDSAGEIVVNTGYAQTGSNSEPLTEMESGNG